MSNVIGRVSLIDVNGYFYLRKSIQDRLSKEITIPGMLKFMLPALGRLFNESPRFQTSSFQASNGDDRL